MKKVFIAATKQNDGKTTVSLGLISNLISRFKNIGFIKPIGQRYLEEDGLKVDEDSILIEEAFGIKCGLKDMSPVAVERGFTENYILHPDKEGLSAQIADAFKRVSHNKDIVIIEGTGHAGVGSVFDHSNANVAKLLDAKVILISSGGIGRPIDEIVLNKALFDKVGVELLGVIVNKVLPEKLNKINKLVCLGLKKFGIEVLGVIPYLSFLSFPSMGQVLAEEHYKLLSGKENLNSIVKKIIIGAMQPHNALVHIEDGSLIITPGDRDDILLTILSCHLSEAKKDVNVSGIILTGGIMPNERIMTLMKSSGIPVLFSENDTYNVASSVHDLTVKIRSKDKEKINLVHKMFKENIDLDKILGGI